VKGEKFLASAFLYSGETPHWGKLDGEVWGPPPRGHRTSRNAYRREKKKWAISEPPLFPKRKGRRAEASNSIFSGRSKYGGGELSTTTNRRGASRRDKLNENREREGAGLSRGGARSWEEKSKGLFKTLRGLPPHKDLRRKKIGNPSGGPSPLLNPVGESRGTWGEVGEGYEGGGGGGEKEGEERIGVE